ncbi:MAG: MFS transporter [Bacteroidota bacterium]
MFSALGHYNYRLHFTGQFISLIGTWMQRVAIGWLIYRLTGSAFMLGLIGFLGLIPALILSPMAGNLVDRKNKFKIVFIAQILFMTQAGVLAFLIWFKYYNITIIALLSLIQGVIGTFETTARQALIPEFVEDPAHLPNAVALNSSAFNAARLLGPAIAGMVLGLYGEDACFIINFLSFIPVIACLLLMKLPPEQIKPKAESIWNGLKKGLTYLEESPDITNLIIILAFSSLLTIPFSTLLPVFAKDIFQGNATTFSWFESAGGLGALLGAIYMTTLKPQRNLQHLVIAAISIFGVGLILLSLSGSVGMALFSTALACIGMMLQTASINTYIQMHTTNELRGRAISYYLMAYQGILPLGTLLIGFMANEIGAKATVLMEGISALLIVSAYLAYLKYKDKISLVIIEKTNLK